MIYKFKLQPTNNTLAFLSFVAFLLTMASIVSCKKDMNTGSSDWIPVDQGPLWTDDARNDYYTWSQGSTILPYSWLLALKQENGQPFLTDGLERYGLLSMENRKLPVGFTLFTDDDGVQQAGMNCAACHTRQIQVEDQFYRIDGGPALLNMEQFTSEIFQAMQATVDDSERFKTFHDDVTFWSKELGSSPPPDLSTFKAEVTQRISPELSLLSASLPTPNMWGIGRIDALNQIFNRVVGIDMAVPPAVVVPEAFAPASVPVRPPFLWNVGKQDYTQWAATFTNGNEHQALLRNVSEVLGVFAHFKPVADPSKPGGFDLLKDNTVDFEGLKYLEGVIGKMGSPRWPWKVDAALAKIGKPIYEAECASCHGKKPGEARPPSMEETWATPVINVGTDDKYFSTFVRTAPTGQLSGILGPKAPVANISGYLSYEMIKQVDPSFQALPGRNVPFGSYEARVLEGIWAAAPYLHNGSVPTLDDLLKPASERPVVFYMGPKYDVEKVGLSALQEARTGYEYKTSTPGNSNVGHEYGTQLSSQQKAALIEYLKTL
ncbi:MAG: hypothetical protein RI973_771 [Bacteroidota bacterium]|jgi:cytochrome c553